ncbi:MAG: hypothetical protein WBC71_13740, partial [Salaquimonas sp.]
KAEVTGSNPVGCTKNINDLKNFGVGTDFSSNQIAINFYEQQFTGLRRTLPNFVTRALKTPPKMSRIRPNKLETDYEASRFTDEQIIAIIKEQEAGLPLARKSMSRINVRPLAVRRYNPFLLLLSRRQKV